MTCNVFGGTLNFAQPTKKLIPVHELNQKSTEIIFCESGGTAE